MYMIAIKFVVRWSKVEVNNVVGGALLLYKQTSCFIQGRLSEDRLQDETDNRIASVLTSLATVICTSVVCEKKAVFTCLKIMKEKHVPWQKIQHVSEYCTYLCVVFCCILCFYSQDDVITLQKSSWSQVPKQAWCTSDSRWSTVHRISRTREAVQCPICAGV